MITDEDLKMFEIEQYNLMREMRGACARGNHGPLVRQLIVQLDAVQNVIARKKGEECKCNCDCKKEIKQQVAKKPATKKK